MSNFENIEEYLISTREKVQFMSNFATMIRGGIAVDESLNVLGESAETKAFGRVLGRIAKEVEQGAPLYSAFKKEERHFGPVAISLIQVGETSGTLDESLLFLSEYLQHGYDLGQEVKSAMVYPKFIFVATVGITIFLVSFILPKLVPLFNSLHVVLPLSTRMLLALALFVKMYWVYVLLGALALFASYFFSRNNVRVRAFIDRFWLVMPLTGGLIRDYQLALFCQLFLTLFKTGTPVNDALAISAKAATNVHYRDALYRVRQFVEDGAPLSRALAAQAGLFPVNMVIIVSAGEKSGSLERSFTALTESYTKEVNVKTKRLPSLIEPILLIFIAFMVGFVAISIVLPIYGITQSLSR